MSHSRLNRVTTGDIIIGAIMALLCFAALYPVWYTIIISFNDANDALRGHIYMWPRKFSLQSYKTVFQDSTIIRAFIITILRTVIGTVTSVFFTAMVGYAFSKKHIMGNKVYTIIGTITMFFGGGLIPTYLLISNMGLLDSMWAVILPGSFSVWNMIIARTYYKGIPNELREAADVDGANELVFFFKILLPVCTPLIAVLVLWQFVGMWNSYFDAMIYLNSANKQPLQLVLRAILIQNEPDPGMIADMQSTAQRAQLAELLKYATIIISSLPLIVMYPFFQKYFDSGIMVGSVKG